MEPKDVREAARIERAVEFCGWGRRVFQACLEQGLSCWVWDQNGAVLAYGVMEIADGWAHVLKVAVWPQAQGRGLGRRILLHLLGEARARGARAAMLEVRWSNRRAQNLYRSLGFAGRGLRRGYYLTRSGCEDALVMAKPLAPNT